MKKYIIIALVTATMLLPTGSVFSTEVWRSPTEMLKWDPDKAQNGYNAFIKNGIGYLLDMEGRVVNTWMPAENGLSGYLFAMENGNWRAQSSTSYGPTGRSGGASGPRLEEYTWDGERVWYWDAVDGMVDDGEGGYAYDETLQTFGLHHDWQLIYNKDLEAWTYLLLVYAMKGETDADNLGVDPALNRTSRGEGRTWQPDALIEVLPDYDAEGWSPANNNTGQIVWYWTFADHTVTTDPGGTAATEEWIDLSGRISMPPVVVSTTDGESDSIRANPQLLNVNGLRYTEMVGPMNDWQHCNSFDYDEETGYIAINAKATSEFYVIDHDGTFVADATPGTVANNWDTNEVGALARGTGGDFLYRFGNPSNYYSGEPAGFGDEGDFEMYGSHDIQWIMPYHWRPPMAAGDTWSAPPEDMALPGGGAHADDINPYGNFLIFDNGCYNPRISGSKILEINPYIVDQPMGGGGGPPGGLQVQATGIVQETETYDDGNLRYVDPGPDAVNNTSGLVRREQVVWEYGGGRSGIYDFYSSYISSCARMPNGNTIIDSGANAHFFEVTPDKEVVWEYVVPPIEDGVALTYIDGSTDGVFRFHRFLSSHPALAGKDLNPGPTLTGREPYQVGEEPEAPAATNPIPPPSGWGTGGITIPSGGGGGGGAAGGTAGGDTGY